MSIENDEYVTVDGVDYKKTELSVDAKAQMINLQVTDQEINRLNQQLAIARTARASYARALEEALPKPDKKVQ